MTHDGTVPTSIVVNVNNAKRGPGVQATLNLSIVSLPVVRIEGATEVVVEKELPSNCGWRSEIVHAWDFVRCLPGTLKVLRPSSLMKCLIWLMPVWPGSTTPVVLQVPSMVQPKSRPAICSGIAVSYVRRIVIDIVLTLVPAYETRPEPEPEPPPEVGVGVEPPVRDVVVEALVVVAVPGRH